ncbi:hypothetical protein Mgra_00010148, partial [Meloidogyne graminicola]
TTENDNNFILELLLNEGYRIKRIILNYLNSNNQIEICNKLIKHLETSTNLSKMISNVLFCFKDLPRSQFNVKGVEMDESHNWIKFYKITNVNNFKLKFKIRVVMHFVTNSISNLIREIEINQII